MKLERREERASCKGEAVCPTDSRLGMAVIVMMRAPFSWNGTQVTLAWCHPGNFACLYAPVPTFGNISPPPPPLSVYFLSLFILFPCFPSFFSFIFPFFSSFLFLPPSFFPVCPSLCLCQYLPFSFCYLFASSCFVLLRRLPFRFSPIGLFLASLVFVVAE